MHVVLGSVCSQANVEEALNIRCMKFLRFGGFLMFGKELVTSDP